MPYVGNPKGKAKRGEYEVEERKGR